MIERYTRTLVITQLKGTGLGCAALKDKTIYLLISVGCCATSETCGNIVTLALTILPLK